MRATRTLQLCPWGIGPAPHPPCWTVRQNPTPRSGSPGTSHNLHLLSRRTGARLPLCAIVPRALTAVGPRHTSRNAARRRAHFVTSACIPSPEILGFFGSPTAPIPTTTTPHASRVSRAATGNCRAAKSPSIASCVQSPSLFAPYLDSGAWRAALHHVVLPALTTTCKALRRSAGRMRV